MKTKLLPLLFLTLFIYADTLSDGVELYNNGQYYKAYQKLERELFNHLSEKEYNYYHALAAKKANKKNEAIASFERALDIDSNYHKARLELAKLYFQTGLYEQSQIEFLTVFNDKKTPQVVKNNIQYYLDQIEKKLQKNSFNGLFLFGAMYDDNVLNGNDLLGTFFGLTKQGIAQNMMLNAGYSINTRTSVDYTLNASYYNKTFFDYDLQNIGLDFYSFGVTLKTKGDREFVIPFKYSLLKYGGVDLLEMYDMQISTNFDQGEFERAQIYGAYNYTLYNAKNSAINRSSTKYKLGSNLMFDKNNMVSLDYSVERQVYSGRTDIDNDAIGVSYANVYELQKSTLLKSTLSYRRRADIYATIGVNRRDDMIKLVLNPIYQIDKNNAWMLNISFTKNISNILVYDYDKNEFTLNYIHTISPKKLEKIFDLGGFL